MKVPEFAKPTVNQIFLKLCAWCAYQERCYVELDKKLQSFDITESDKDLLIEKLRAENFINEERFTKSYVGGKFRMKQWGKLKITAHLKARQISTRLITEAIAEEIPMEDYRAALELILAHRLQLEMKKPDLLTKTKAKQYAFSRGYESWLIDEVLESLSPSPKKKLF